MPTAVTAGTTYKNIFLRNHSSEPDEVAVHRTEIYVRKSFFTKMLLPSYCPVRNTHRIDDELVRKSANTLIYTLKSLGCPVTHFELCYVAFRAHDIVSLLTPPCRNFPFLVYILVSWLARISLKFADIAPTHLALALQHGHVALSFCF